MIYFTFYIEVFDENSVELRIKNLDGSIPIRNANDPVSYVDAAKLAMDRIKNDLKNPVAAYPSRGPIGFIKLRSQ